MDDNIGFILCLPLSKAPEGIPQIKTKCCICQGDVVINPNNKFEGVPVSDLKPMCGSCMVDITENDDEGINDIGIRSTSVNLPPLYREYGAQLLANGAEKLIKRIKEHRDEYRADNPKGGN